jgi:alpha-tubulin suppressor-like RCC1 family protein
MPVNESNTIQYTVNTSRVPDGTILYWKTTGNTTNSDIVGGNTGSITITNNQAVFNVTIAADETADNVKTLGISLLTGSLNGTQVTTTAAPIVINDTSNTAPPTYVIYSWGNNLYGQLATNDTIYKSSPTQVGTASWTKTSGSLGLKTNGTIWAWGFNNNGQLGLNHRINMSSPTQIGSLTNWADIGQGQYHGLAIKGDGTLWSFGYNAEGQLLSNNTVARSSPVQVGSSTDWRNVYPGLNYALFIKTDDKLWGGGENWRGNLGNSTAYNYYSSPVQIGSASWSKAAAGHNHSLAIKTDGTLWAAGFNIVGELGIGNTNLTATFTQVGSATTWTQISAIWRNSYGIQSDGSLWSWGNNNGFGELGRSSGYREVPSRIGSDTWTQISQGPDTGTAGSLAAIKTDGTLWTWGSNGNGRLGTNTGSGNPIYRQNPAVVGSKTNWTKVSLSLNSMIAIASE